MSETLFTATLPAKVLKEAVLSAASISDIIHLEFDAQQYPPIRFWAIDANRLFSMDGQISSDAEDIEGDEAATVQIKSKLLKGCIAMYKTTPKDRITVTLERGGEDEEFTLAFVQTVPGQEPNRRHVSVEASEVGPVDKQVPTGAFASIDLTQFTKVLNSFRGSSDTVTLAVAKDLFTATLSTKHLEDGWQHPAPTRGKGQALFAVRSLHTVISAASNIDTVGDIFVAEGHPLLVEVSSEQIRARYFVADREAMR